MFLLLFFSLFPPLSSSSFFFFLLCIAMPRKLMRANKQFSLCRPYVRPLYGSQRKRGRFFVPFLRHVLNQHERSIYVPATKSHSRWTKLTGKNEGAWTYAYVVPGITRKEKNISSGQQQQSYFRDKTWIGDFIVFLMSPPPPTSPAVHLCPEARLCSRNALAACSTFKL